MSSKPRRGNIKPTSAATNAFSAAFTLLAFTATATFAADAPDPNLVGCWRSQHVEQHLRDNSVVHANNDCITEISATEFRTACTFTQSAFNSTSTYTLPQAGRMLVTPAATPGTTPATPRETQYTLDGDWVTITSVPPPPALNQPEPPEVTARTPVKIVGLMQRVPPKQTCAPRGPSGLRLGNSPVSSLALTPPTHFVPLLTDDPTDATISPVLAKAINADFLIGQFIPRGITPAHKPGALLLPPGNATVLIVQDHRAGAKPVKADDFERFKTQLKTELAEAQKTCEEPRRICFLSQPPPSKAVHERNLPPRIMTTQYIHVGGRVAVVYASVAGPRATSEPRSKAAADAFAERLWRDNP